jgi:hypothetical protein
VVLDNPAYTYAEGLAWHEFGPTHHAWVVDSEGSAIDPTWPKPGTRYYGVTFTVPELGERNLGGPALDEAAMQHFVCSLASR